MKRLYSIPALLLATALFYFSAHGQGTTIFQHSGNNDPINEGFLLESYGHPQLGPLTNDLGMNAWSIQMTRSDAAQYGQTASAQQSALIEELSWDLSITLRILEAPTTPSYDISVELGTLPVRYTLYFGEETDGDPAVQVSGANLSGSSLSPVFVLNGAGSTYNNYQLIYNATADTTSLWINGVDEIDGIAGGQLLNGNVYLSWSAYQHGNNVEANWNTVSLETIPEPRELALIFFCSGVLIYVRRCRM